jgi:putative oxidoreductase
MKTKLVAMLLAAIFLLSGSAKLAGLEFEIEAFQRWGYPLWFMYLIGSIEVSGGIALLFRQVSALAAAGLALMMIGAVMTHVLHAEWAMLAAAGVILALSAWRAMSGRNDIVALLPRNQIATAG